MVQYRDLNAPPSRMLADVIADMKAQERQSKTGDHGKKHMGETGDSTWVDPGTGAAHSVREIPSAMDQLREQLAEGVATTSKLNTVSTSAPTTAEGYPDAAFWTVVELGPPMVESDRWQVVDGAWTQIGLDAGRLVTGTVDAGLIDAVALAARMVTAGLIRTAASGQRLEIDSNGLIMWGIDPDGVEYEMVRIGPSGVNLLTIGDTTVAPDGIQSPSAAFEQLSVGGEGLQEVLARYPRGMRAWGQLVGSSQFDSNTTIMARRGELQTTLEPNRLYRMRLSEHLVEVSGGVNTNIVEELRYTYDAVPVNIQNTPDPGTYRGVFARNPAFAGSATNINGMEFLLNSGDWTGERTFWLMWLMRTENADRPVKVLATNFYSPIMSIEDLGPAQPDILKRWNDGNGGEAQDTAPTVRRFTKVYTATGFGGDTSGGDVVQGQYASYGNRSGGWTFPSMTGDLAGATIERIRVFLYANHWYYNAGGTASIRATNGAHKGHTGPVVTSANWPRNAGRWVTLPASMHDGFKAGTYKGIGVQTSNTSLTYYGRFAGNPSDAARKAKIEIQYRR